ncbi:MAG: hypothetical protein Q9218_003968 [Villophora microphyllina]
MNYCNPPFTTTQYSSFTNCINQILFVACTELSAMAPRAKTVSPRPETAAPAGQSVPAQGAAAVGDTAPVVVNASTTVEEPVTTGEPTTTGEPAVVGEPAKKTPFVHHGTKRTRGEKPEYDEKALDSILKKPEAVTGGTNATAQEGQQPPTEGQPPQEKQPPIEKQPPRKKARKSGLPPNLTRVPINSQSKLPSPYSTSVLDADFAKGGLLWEDPAPPSQTALRMQRTMHPPFWSNDRVGQAFVRWFRPVAARGLTTADDIIVPVVSEAWVEDHCFISWDDIEIVRMPRKSRLIDRKRAHAPKARRVVEIVREKDEYFLLWETPTDVKVNGETLLIPGTGDFAIGPLPDFAIITIETATIFWWRNKKAVTYISESFKRKVSRRVGQENVTAKEIADKRNEWARIYEDGLNKASTRCNDHVRQQQQEGVENPGNWRIIPRADDILDRHVFLASAAIWRSQRLAGQQFAFGGVDQQQLLRIENSGAEYFAECRRSGVPPVVGDAPDDLILPVIISANGVSPPSSARKAQFGNDAQQPAQPAEGETAGLSGGVGHTVFAAAHQNPDGSIETRVLDSLPGYVKRSIHSTVEKVVERSGWLARANDGLPSRTIPPPRFNSQDVMVPLQGGGQNSCGVHTILNSWRYMLRLPEVNSRVRLHQPGYGSRDYVWLDHSFIVDAMALINLTIAGFMDARTIQAFMNYNGFCALQHPGLNDLSTDLIPKIDSDILGDELGVEQHSEGEAAPPTTAEQLAGAIKDEAKRQRLVARNAEKLQYFTTEEQQNYIDMAGGNEDHLKAFLDSALVAQGIEIASSDAAEDDEAGNDNPDDGEANAKE